MRFSFSVSKKTYNFIANYQQYINRINLLRNVNVASIHTSYLLHFQGINTCTNNPNYFINKLFKNQLFAFSFQFREKNVSKRRKEKSEEYESASDSDDEELLKEAKNNPPGTKIIHVQCDSLRSDVILKNALGIARNRLQHLFYEGRMRINGKKVFKLHIPAQIGDEIDLIHDVSPENENNLTVSRVEVLKGRPTGDIIMLTVRKHKSLLIENYSGQDKWEKHIPTKEEKKDDLA